MSRVPVGRICVILLFGLSLALPSIVTAEVYQWVDEKGELHFSDTPPPKSKQRGVKVDRRFDRDESAPTRVSVPAGSERAAYKGEGASRLIVLEKVGFDLPPSAKKPKPIGRDCKRDRDISIYDAAGWAKRIQFDSGFYGRLDELGYETPISNQLNFAHEAKKAPELSVIGTIKGVKFGSCGKSTEMTVLWRMFDNLKRKVVYEVTTKGNYRHVAERTPATKSSRQRSVRGLRYGRRTQSGSESLLHGMLEAFVSSANRFFELEQFASLMTPNTAVASIQEEEVEDTEPVVLSLRYGNGTATFSTKVESLKSATATVRTAAGHGSGFLISSGGYLVTNYHVIAGNSEVLVVLGEAELDAKVLRSDAERDVALLQLKGFSNAAPLELARTKPAQGDTLYAVGTPLSEELSHTVTKGILSATRTMKGQEYYQTDAAVNHGSSGGPVFNDQGELVAITVSGLMTRSGGTMDINYLIPIHDALDVLGVRP